MKSLCILACLILQINCQIALASGPAINAPHLDTGNFMEKLSQAVSNNFGKTNNKQPLLTFTGNMAAVETGNAVTKKAAFVAQTDCLNLTSGNILVCPEKDIFICTEEGIISIASGATIFIMKSGMDTVIYDLYQARQNQVSIVVNRHKLMMESGCMLVLTRQKTKNFEALDVNCHSIKYCKAREINLDTTNTKENTVNAFAANFSIFSALGRIQPLKQLLDSKDRRDQLLLQKLLKSAAMLRVKQDIRRSDHV